MLHELREVDIARDQFASTGYASAGVAFSHLRRALIDLVPAWGEIWAEADDNAPGWDEDDQWAVAADEADESEEAEDTDEEPSSDDAADAAECGEEPDSAENEESAVEEEEPDSVDAEDAHAAALQPEAESESSSDGHAPTLRNMPQSTRQIAAGLKKRDGTVWHPRY